MLSTEIPARRRRALLRESLAGRTGPALRFRSVPTAAAAGRAAACGLDGVHLAWADLGPSGEVVAGIVRAMPLPVLVDLGGIADVERAVELLEVAGVSAILLDDLARPDPAGAAGPPPGSDDPVTRLAVALGARRDPDLLIGVRPAVRSTEGLIDAVDRARAQVAAGADLIVVGRPETEAGYTVLREALDIPLLVDATASDHSPPPTPRRLAELGMDVVIHPVTLPRTAPDAAERGVIATRDTRHARAGGGSAARTTEEHR
ncbi:MULTISPECIES: isocitrate lyase/phosphoenolpyruvate mutase family protein [Pseudonocardia]|uniref:2,3-dimethylmalate lyase n=2 Tax=Pseudonocardia TaxID=1847 RepID=A0A1Y2N9B6_PSEAH|nr:MULTISPECIES: isocitrate lyase/phosphoenolpyruvate mutase family protein [Pseudonocardia]OSY44060.1 2,3-dimethylmalate lyase [Pseudonocardia autotrophica]TDN74210.1 methylisocitrate lyase [Pseudonocardia autotrophica]BBG04970.1 hypothetical protein Pdca_61790 [Pseudonocardia autotrophica]GEC23626.1 hypothetical protein PSA01_06550 [Pseudonocardia saturnea]